jgi:hypothetical protein
MEEMMNMNQAKTDAKFKDLTETIEKTQLELYTAEVSFYARTRNLQKDLIDTRHELQALLEAVGTTTERGNTPAVGASASPPPTYNGTTSWSVFRRQSEIVAEHNSWSKRDKSTYLITALKGGAADVLPVIPTNTTYENTFQALEDRFSDQHFAVAYRYQVRTRIQKAGESLQDFATALELLAHRAYPTLPEDHIGREAGNTFAYRVHDPDKNSTAATGRKDSKHGPRQAKKLQVVLAAGRSYEINTMSYRQNQSPPTF